MRPVPVPCRCRSLVFLALTACAGRSHGQPDIPARLRTCPGAVPTTVADVASLVGTYELRLFVGDSAVAEGTLTLVRTADRPPGTAPAGGNAAAIPVVGWVDAPDGRFGPFKFSIDPASRDWQRPGVVVTRGSERYAPMMIIGGWGGHSANLSLGLRYVGAGRIGGRWDVNPRYAFTDQWCATRVAARPASPQKRPA